MSCFVMNPETIRKIGCTLAHILTSIDCGGDCTIATNAAQSAELPKAFSRYYSRIRGYNGEGIAEDLHRINDTAYCTRYNMDVDTHVSPLPGKPEDLDIMKRAEYHNGNETPQPWHYELASMLDCWLYQTAEDATMRDPIRLAVKRFAMHLNREIVQHSANYSGWLNF